MSLSKIINSIESIDKIDVDLNDFLSEKINY